ncbi:SdrD B-like domain-containing protein, partial [Lentzea aerocolonigenes]
MTAPAANAAPELKIDKAVNVTDAPSGGQIEYTIGVSCASFEGESCAGAVVRDPLPSYLDINNNTQFAIPLFKVGAGAGISDDGQIVGNEVVWTMGPGFIGGVTAQLKLVVTTPQGITPEGAVLVNHASVQLAPQAPVVSQQDVRTTLHAASAIKAEKTGPTQVLSGSNGSYQVRACFAPQSNPNVGLLDIDNAQLVDTFPAGAVVVSSDGGVVSGNTITWNIGRMDVGALQPTGGCVQRNVVLNFPTANFPPNAPPVVNTVVASGTNPSGQPIPPSTASVSTGITGDATISGYLSKQASRGSLANGEDVFWYYGVANNGTGNLDTFRIDDVIDSNLKVTQFAPGFWPGNATLQITYDTNTGQTNVPLPGSPFAPGATPVDPASLNLPPGTEITAVHYVWSGVLEPGWGASYVGIGTTVRNPGWDGTPLTDNEQVTNCLDASVTGAGQTVPLQRFCASATFRDNPVRAYVSTSATGNPGGANVGVVGGLFAFTTVAGVGNDTFGPLTQPVVTVRLPAGFTLDGTYTFDPGTSGLPAPDQFEQVPLGPGGTLLRWTWPAGTSVTAGKTWSLNYNVRVGPTVTPGGIPYDSTISPGDAASPVFECSSQNPEGLRNEADGDDRDGDDRNTDPICFHQEGLTVLETTNLTSFKQVRGQVDAEQGLGFSSSGHTYPGGQVDYRISVVNSTSATFAAGTQVIDILPRVGDTGVIGTGQRGSQFDVQLTGQITGAGATIEYNTSGNPCRPEVGGPTTGCDATPWVPWAVVAGDPTSVKSIRFTFDGPIAPGGSLTFEWPMRAETGATPGEIAYNSFAYHAIPANGDPLPPSEPERVPVIVEPLPALGVVGDRVWSDTNANGVQDNGEEGIGGVRVQLWQPGPDGVVGTGDDTMVNNGETFTDSSDATKGQYLFTALPAGNYYVRFFPPAGMIASPANQGDNALDSDGNANSASPNYGWTEAFALGQAQDDRTWDMGLVQATPSIHIEKYVTGGSAVQDDADAAPGPSIPIGSPVTWTYVVTNTGNMDLKDVQVTDDRGVVLTCPGMPAPTDVFLRGASFTCTGTGTAQAGDYVNVGTTSGQPVDTAGQPSGGRVTSTDPAHYTGTDPLTASVGDFVWRDLDGDGVQDAGEPGVSGVAVELFRQDPGGPVSVGTTTTDANGFYQFTGLPAGSYSVKFTAPAGMVASPQNQGGDDAVDSDGDAGGTTQVFTLDIGEHDTTWDQGLILPANATIGDFVWRDLDGDGVQDAGEPGVQGVTVQLFTTGPDGQAGTADDVSLGTHDTDVNGFYLFTDLPAGTYFLKFLAPSGTYITPRNQGGDDAVDSDADATVAGPAYGRTEVITLDQGEVDRTWDMGLVQAQIDIEKYVTGGSAVRDDADNPPGPTVPNGSAVTWTYVVTNTGQLPLTNVVVTDDKGVTITCPNQPSVLAPGASFECTASGTAVPGLYRNVGDVVGDVVDGSGQPTSDEVRDSDAAHYTGVDPSTGSVGDFVWADTNGNGVQDAGEAGVPGVTVELVNAGADGQAGTGDDVSIGTKITGANGDYLFTGLSAGSYFVRFTAPAGTALSPQNQGGNDAVDSDGDAAGVTAVFALAQGQQDLSWDQGVVPPVGSVGDRVWTDADGDGVQDAGEPGVPGVTVELFAAGPDGQAGTGDDVSLGTKTTDANGAYLFTGLPAGSYFVRFVVPAGSYVSP